MCPNETLTQTWRKLGTLTLHHDPGWAVRSHGWPLLRPFMVDGNRLNWVMDLPYSGVRQVQVRWSVGSWRLSIWTSGELMTSEDQAYIRNTVGWMFRRDERFDEFWTLCSKRTILRPCVELGMGALLRSPSVFEDVVKTMCTMNCHWRNTKRMVDNLCAQFGQSAEVNGAEQKVFAFPVPGRLAKASEVHLKRASLGFRARFISGFSRSVANGQIILEDWAVEEDPDRLRSTLLGVAGIGPYGANHMLMLLGHYRLVPCDSEVRTYLGLPPTTHQKTVEREVVNRYQRWGKYAFLAYKFERVLRHNNYVDCS